MSKRRRSAREAYDACAAAYAAGVTADCEACHQPCPEHGFKGCRLCHTHPGECGYGGCAAPEQLVAIDYWQGAGTVAQRRALCATHMRWWRHECLDGVDRTIQSPGPDRPHASVVVASAAVAPATGDTLVGARRVVRRLVEETEYAGLCVEVLTASLGEVRLDAATLAEVAGVADAVEQMASAARRALAGLDARHAVVEDAVNATPHVARASFYRR